MRFPTSDLFPLLLLTSVLAGSAHAEDGHQAWLRYARISNPALEQYRHLPRRIVALGNSAVSRSASAELARGLESMLGTPVVPFQQSAPTLPDQDAFVVGTGAETCRLLTTLCQPKTTRDDSFTITATTQNHHIYWILSGSNDRGELYAVFHVLEQVATNKPLTDTDQSPAAPIRWVQQWDNLDGSIERGYAGRSIFFDTGHVRSDMSRVSDYGRLLSSIGINGLTVNNVNSDLRTLDPAMLREFAHIADALRPWGVPISLSVDLSSPQIVGHLPTFDPLEPAVDAWWKGKTEEIYALIPDFAGFVVKADSEGRAGPSQYHRTPAQAANVLARALQPHHGLVLYRGFVYNHHLDWKDLKADRARAGHDNFHALDGAFEPNVVIQVKHGPIDFQVREPVSPLFAALQHTSQAIELQTTQEYTGQQRHMVFLIPMWKQALDTDLRANNQSTPVKEIVEGKSFHQSTGGFVSVVNVGLDANWLHHPMALANLYGFGKLAWNPDLTSEQIIDSWTRLTFGDNPAVVSAIADLQLGSWRVYEQYTGPLGIGTLTDIISVHFGPGVGSAENNGWGQWFRADHLGVGMDRTVSTGTGYIGQYPSQLAAVYESLKTCPDDLLLFMHHVPYSHPLHNGKTVIQHIYDEHYAGAVAASTYAPRWEKLHGLIDDERYQQVLSLFTYQAGHANVWRDAVNTWFSRMSGIPDSAGQIGEHPGRIEAENMIAEGYTPVDVTPSETASNGKATVCNRTVPCTLSATVQQPSGAYKIAVQYFDLRSGASQYDLLLNGKPIAHWTASNILPPAVIDQHLDGHTSTRFTTGAVELKAGDTLILRGTPDGSEPAPVDYLEISK